MMMMMLVMMMMMKHASGLNHFKFFAQPLLIAGPNDGGDTHAAWLVSAQEEAILAGPTKGYPYEMARLTGLAQEKVFVTLNP